MSNYRHHVSGFFAHRPQAEQVVSKLAANGIPSERIHLFDKNAVESGQASIAHTATDSDDKVLKDVVVDGAIGAVVGTGVGALVEVGLIMANVTLFVASPLIAPLVLLGWGASLGGIVGATAGASEKIKPLSELVHDAITNGQIVVVAETRSEAETKIASDIFQAAIGDYNDVA